MCGEHETDDCGVYCHNIHFVRRDGNSSSKLRLGHPRQFCSNNYIARVWAILKYFKDVVKVVTGNIIIIITTTIRIHVDGTLVY